jgi:hypothetical protein
VVGITAVSDNPIYNGPGGTYQLVSELMADESASVFVSDETGL